MICFTILSFTSNEAGYHEEEDSPLLPSSKDSNLGQHMIHVHIQVNMIEMLHG